MDCLRQYMTEGPVSQELLLIFHATVLFPELNDQPAIRLICRGPLQGWVTLCGYKNAFTVRKKRQSFFSFLISFPVSSLNRVNFSALVQRSNAATQLVKIIKLNRIILKIIVISSVAKSIEFFCHIYIFQVDIQIVKLDNDILSKYKMLTLAGYFPWEIKSFKNILWIYSGYLFLMLKFLWA